MSRWGHLLRRRLSWPIRETRSGSPNGTLGARDRTGCEPYSAPAKSIVSVIPPALRWAESGISRPAEGSEPSSEGRHRVLRYRRRLLCQADGVGNAVWVSQ
jgi:hypothetical protein